jgi:hypothetical protein
MRWRSSKLSIILPRILIYLRRKHNSRANHGLPIIIIIIIRFRAELGLLLSSRSLVLHVGVHDDVTTPVSPLIKKLNTAQIITFINKQLEFFNLLCWKSGDGKTTFIAKTLARVKMIFECAIENCGVSKDHVPPSHVAHAARC